MPEYDSFTVLLIFLFVVVVIRVFVLKKASRTQRYLEKGVLSLSDMQPNENMLFMEYEYPTGEKSSLVAVRKKIFDGDDKSFIVGNLVFVFDELGDFVFPVIGRDAFYDREYFDEITLDVKNFWANHRGA